MKPTDEQLMTAYGKGDDSAFARLYEKHKAPLYRYFTRQLPGKQAKAEELFQDTWFRVVDNRKKYTPSAKFTTWLYQIAHNLVVDEYRKSENREVKLALVSGDHFSTPDDPEQRKASALKHCIELLSPVQREAFLLKHEAGFELAQISQIAKTRQETIKTRLRYALDQLRQCLIRKLGERT